MPPICLIPRREMPVYMPLMAGFSAVQRAGTCIRIGQLVNVINEVELITCEGAEKLAFRLVERPTRYVLAEDINDAARECVAEYNRQLLQRKKAKLPTQKDAAEEEMREACRQILEILSSHSGAQIRLVVSNPAT
jgi:hypothetical protein